MTRGRRTVVRIMRERKRGNIRETKRELSLGETCEDKIRRPSHIETSTWQYARREKIKRKRKERKGKRKRRLGRWCISSRCEIHPKHGFLAAAALLLLRLWGLLRLVLEVVAVAAAIAAAGAVCSYLR